MKWLLYCYSLDVSSTRCQFYFADESDFGNVLQFNVKYVENRRPVWFRFSDGNAITHRINLMFCDVEWVKMMDIRWN